MALNPSFTLVDTVEGVRAFLDSVRSVPNDPPSLYVDLEGINLGRLGSISILQVYVYPQRTTYLLDVHILGASCFSTPDSFETTLKDLLESPDTVKVFFDVRNDSDALFSHFGIQLAGVQDLQLMQLATRSFSRAFVTGLSKCIEKDLPLSRDERMALKETKEKGVRLFAPERGGSYEVFNRRPMPEAIVEYCVQDVELLPRLWKQYDGKMASGRRERVAKATADRITLSQSAGYSGKGQHMALAPEGWSSKYFI